MNETEGSLMVTLQQIWLLGRYEQNAYAARAEVVAIRICINNLFTRMRSPWMDRTRGRTTGQKEAETNRSSPSSNITGTALAPPPARPAGSFGKFPT